MSDISPSRDPVSLTESDDLFADNEGKTNHYTVVCLRFAAGVVAVMWLLNLLGFFIVDQTMMILSWACPVILSCHYYSPRFTRFTTLGTLVFMFLSFYTGIFIGVWDGNIIRSNAELTGVAVRWAFIRAQMTTGDNILIRALNFYYLPRAVIIVVVYLICSTLSKRTHGLLSRQAEITREAERISAELNVATQIQTSMLPCIFPAFPEQPEFDIYASMAPAKEVGGDFYDFFMVDDRHLAVVIADVSGKGVPAALFMVIGKTLIKDHTQPGRDLGEVFSEVNQLLCEANSEGLFITAFEGVLDLDSGDLRYVNAGHEVPFLSVGGGKLTPYPLRPGFVLAGMETTRYRSGSLTLRPGDKLFHYTDGIPEAVNAALEPYGMERLQAVLRAHGERPPSELLAAVKADVDRFAGGTVQFDDITMLCLEYRGETGKG